VRRLERDVKVSDFDQYLFFAYILLCFSGLACIILGVSDCTMTEVCFLSNVITDIVLKYANVI